jgi:hypothetical protein
VDVIICDCFDGDDLEVAKAQHDLYSGLNLPEDHLLGGRTTLSYFWVTCVLSTTPERRMDRSWMRLQGHLSCRYRFDHRLLQAHHDLFAAHYRYLVRPGLPTSGVQGNAVWRRLEHVRAWRDHLLDEVPALMKDDVIAEEFAKSLVYRDFEVGFEAGRQLGRLMLERYGSACVSQAQWIPHWFGISVEEERLQA